MKKIILVFWGLNILLTGYGLFAVRAEASLASLDFDYDEPVEQAGGLVIVSNATGFPICFSQTFLPNEIVLCTVPVGSVVQVDLNAAIPDFPINVIICRSQNFQPNRIISFNLPEGLNLLSIVSLDGFYAVHNGYNLGVLGFVPIQ